MGIACVYCKHHEFVFTEEPFGEEPDAVITLCGIDDCFCADGHDNEHDSCCSVFDAKEAGECAFFSRGEDDDPMSPQEAFHDMRQADFEREIYKQCDEEDRKEVAEDIEIDTYVKMPPIRHYTVKARITDVRPGEPRTIKEEAGDEREIAV